jgi:hypothetical protein
MEKLYRKKANGRYEEYTYGYGGELSDGVWLVQNKPSSKSISSLFWKVGNIPRLVDVTTHAALQAHNDKLTDYIQKLKDIESEEYKEALQICGGYLRGPVYFSNISAHDIINLILRELSKEIEQK